MRTGKFTGECFIYTNAANRLQYVIGEQTYTIRPCDTELYVLGYLPQLGRVFAADKDMGIYSFALSLSVVEYQTAILQGDYARAEQLLPSIPAAQRPAGARSATARCSAGTWPWRRAASKRRTTSTRCCSSRAPSAMRRSSRTSALRHVRAAR